MVAVGGALALPWAGCSADEGPKPAFDWPSAAGRDRAYAWDPAPLSPVTAVSELRIEADAPRTESSASAAGPAVRRHDRWHLALASAGEGHITREVRSRVGEAPERVERSESVLRGGELATRTGGGAFLARPATDPWVDRLARPGRDFDQLLVEAGLIGAPVASEGEALGRRGRRLAWSAPGAEAEVLVDGVTGVALKADLRLDRPAHRVRLSYALSAIGEAVSVPRVEAVAPDRDRPLPRRARLLDGLGP